MSRAVVCGIFIKNNVSRTLYQLQYRLCTLCAIAIHVGLCRPYIPQAEGQPPSGYATAHRANLPMAIIVLLCTAYTKWL